MMHRISVVLVCAVGLAACDAGDAVTARADSTDFGAMTIAAPVAQGYGDLLNAIRASAGLRIATPDARLNAVAQRFAEDMVARDYFGHTSPDGGTLVTRLAAAGYSQCGAAENIAYGVSSPETAHALWMSSPPHRSTLLFSGNVAYGYGVSADKAVLVLARPC